MYAIFVQLVEHLVSLVHKPNVLIVLSLASVEDDDHGSVEGLLSDGPADEDCRMAVGKEEESLQKLDRTVDDQRPATNGSLMETISTTSAGRRVRSTVEASECVRVTRW
jgi:hypothetical protein